MGEPAPDFVLESINGGDVRLSDFKGKVVLLNFWATWCPPCRAEMPSLENLKKQMKGRDFVIIAVSIDNVETPMIKNFVSGNGYTFTVLHDAEQAVAEVYLVMGIPTTYVIDKGGTIVDKSVGMEYWDSPDRIRQLMSLAK
jgi:peroxiredoxin